MSKSTSTTAFHYRRRRQHDDQLTTSDDNPPVSQVSPVAAAARFAHRNTSEGGASKTHTHTHTQPSSTPATATVDTHRRHLHSILLLLFFGHRPFFLPCYDDPADQPPQQPTESVRPHFRPHVVFAATASLNLRNQHQANDDRTARILRLLRSFYTTLQFPFVYLQPLPFATAYFPRALHDLRQKHTTQNTTFAELHMQSV